MSRRRRWRIGHQPVRRRPRAHWPLTLVGAVLLVLDVVVGRQFAVPVAAILAVFLVFLWFVLPLPMRRRNDRDSADGDDVE